MSYRSPLYCSNCGNVVSRKTRLWSGNSLTGFHYVICSHCNQTIHDEPEHNQEYSRAYAALLKDEERYRNEEEHQEVD